jgi:hypothetical protein
MTRNRGKRVDACKIESAFLKTSVACGSYPWNGRKVTHRFAQKLGPIYKLKWISETQRVGTPVSKCFIMIYIPHAAFRKFASSYYIYTEECWQVSFARWHTLPVCKFTRFNDQYWTRR